MTLYDWLLKNGGPVDYWHNISPAINAWCKHTIMDAEDYSINGLLNNPAEDEKWANGVVLPFGILLELRNIKLPAGMAEMDFSEKMAELGYRWESE